MCGDLTSWWWEQEVWLGEVTETRGNGINASVKGLQDKGSAFSCFSNGFVRIPGNTISEHLHHMVNW
jgi:hypothetical protein